MIIVTICHGDSQVENLSRLPESLFEFSNKILVVNSNKVKLNLPDYYEIINPTHGVANFNAGANRDFAINYAIEKYELDDLVFFDGDCIPDPSWSSCYFEYFKTNESILYGARFENGLDGRLTYNKTFNYKPTLHLDRTYKVSSLSEILQHRILSSCNFGISKRVLPKLKKKSKIVHSTDRLFYPGFDGVWGGEDSGLALLAYHSNVEITGLPSNDASVLHIPHNPTRITIKNLEKIVDYNNLVVEKLGV
jgi:hypothetical protein